jgi:type IV pilus assembly protein PilB
LTARDLVDAMRAIAGGADARTVLGEDIRWEAMFGALLSLLLKKQLVADWEFVEELSRLQKR